MRSWHEKRAQALVDRSRFTAEELAWLEITDDQGGVTEQDARVFIIDTQPIDPLTRPSRFDIRNLPGRK